MCRCHTQHAQTHAGADLLVYVCSMPQQIKYELLHRPKPCRTYPHALERCSRGTWIHTHAHPTRWSGARAAHGYIHGYIHMRTPCLSSRAGAVLSRGTWIHTWIHTHAHPLYRLESPLVVTPCSYPLHPLSYPLRPLELPPGVTPCTPCESPLAPPGVTPRSYPAELPCCP